MSCTTVRVCYRPLGLACSLVFLFSVTHGTCSVHITLPLNGSGCVSVVFVFHVLGCSIRVDVFIARLNIVARVARGVSA